MIISVPIRAWILARRLLVAAGALALTGCGTLPMAVERPASTALAPAQDSPLVRIAQASLPEPGQTGFRLMPNGYYSLDTRVELARRAKHSLDVQYYHLHNDKTGRLLLRELRDAALRGVRVRLLLDDLYTIGGDALFRAFSAVPNVEVRLFNPFCCGRTSLLNKYVSSLADFGRLNHRMHNKLFIADGAMAVAGGRNIADEYFMRSATDNFLDMDAFMIGAVIPQLQTIFDTYWNSRHVYPVESIIRTDLDRPALRREFDHIVDDGEQMMTWTLPSIDILGYGPLHEELDTGRLGLVWGKAKAFADSPEKVNARTEEAATAMSVSMNVLDLVRDSQHEVMLVSPYFVPGRKGVDAFDELLKRDVRVTILTNSLASNDEPLVHTGYARYRMRLLKAGVDLYEISPSKLVKNERLMLPGMSQGRLHAKTAVIDSNLVFIGSMNLDPRSASKNTELGIIAESPQLAREVLRALHISKLQSTYRVRLGKDGRTIEWLTMDEKGEVVLTTEPDTSFFSRFKHWFLSPFVPEDQL